MQAAAATLATEYRVLSSIMATAHSHMSFLRGGPVQESLAVSTVPLSAITDGTPLTLRGVPALGEHTTEVLTTL